MYIHEWPHDEHIRLDCVLGAVNTAIFVLNHRDYKYRIDGTVCDVTHRTRDDLERLSRRIQRELNKHEPEYINAVSTPE